MVAMNDTEITADRDEQRDRGGRFVNGGKAGPGRPRGSRSKLSEDFLQDLHAAWNAHGIQALERCAMEEPSQFCKLIANLLPRDVNLNLTPDLDVADFAARFRNAVSLLGNAPPRSKPLRTIAARTSEPDDAG
jgi:hypothetical protein